MSFSADEFRKWWAAERKAADDLVTEEPISRSQRDTGPTETALSKIPPTKDLAAG